MTTAGTGLADGVRVQFLSEGADFVVFICGQQMQHVCLDAPQLQGVGSRDQVNKLPYPVWSVSEWLK